MKNLSITFCFILATVWAYGQQYPLYTNYITNGIGFNPAIPAEKGVVDLRGTYRTQWVSLSEAPVTSIFGVRGMLNSLPLTLGAQFFNDATGILGRTGFSGNLAYSQKIDENTVLTVGVSGGAYNFKVGNGVIVSDNSDVSVANGQDGVWVPDFTAGAYLKSGRVFLGVSTPQVLQNNVRFFNDQSTVESELVRHYYFMTGVDLPLSSKLVLQPSVLMKFVNPAPLQIDCGALVTYDQKFWVGANYRHKDAIAAIVGMQVKQSLGISYAYDVTTTDVKTVSNGSHEITAWLRLGKKSDRDGDGIPDKDDKCPDEPGTKENDGCPDDPLADAFDPNDSDGDGVPDKDDKCPDEKGTKANNGCPFGDKDQDGIRDDVDDCPELFGFAANNGCPIMDRDKDGIVDNLDACPDVPGPMSNNGCPIDIASLQDSDGDGIPDKDDKCPNIKGVREGEGCPAITASERMILELAITNLYYDTDKNEIWNSSYRYLDKLGNLLVQRPELKVRIEGHADSRGSEAHNLELSKRRAEAVYFYLSNRNVPRNQMILEYYGEGEPAASNVSDGGRQQNRRVQMSFVFE